MSGWIKIHRSLLDHWVSQEPELLAVFIRLLAEANHTDRKTLINGSLVEVKRGQLIFGREAFSTRSSVSIAKVRRYIKLLKDGGAIDQQVFSKYSIISITNYDKYQVIDQQVASRQPADNQQATTLKECKELKEEKKEPLSASKMPDCPYQDIADIYNRVLPELPKAVRMGDRRKKTIRARWKEDKRHQSLDFWEWFFGSVRNNDWWMGRSGNFQADIDFLVSPSKFDKVIEQANHNRGSHG